MARTVLVGWELGGGLGHLMRLRPLAEALLRDGCRVVVASRSRTAAETVFGGLLRTYSSLSLVPAPAPRPLPPRPGGDPATDTLADVLALMGYADPKRLVASVMNWYRLVDTEKPDLVVSDFAPALNLVARGRVPLVVVGNGYTIPPARPTLPPIRPWDDRIPETSESCERAILRLFNAFAEANRFRGLGTLADAFHGDATFVCTFPELDPYARFRDGETHAPYTVARPTQHVPLEERPLDTAFVYLPASHPHRVEVLDVLASLSVRTTYFGADVPTWLPPGIQSLDGPPALESLLPTVRLTIHHGGLGTAHAGLLAGTPQIVLPRELEHHVTAHALTRLNAGIAFPAARLLDRDALGRAALRCLPDTDVAARFAALTARFAERDPRRTLSRIVATCRTFLDHA